MKTKQILTILLVIILLISGYYIFASYQNQQKETQKLIDDQQKALQNAQQKITDIQKSNEQIQTTTQNNTPNGTNQNSINSSEIDPLLTGVVEIECGIPTQDGYIQGSGSLWKLQNRYVVITNHHVVSSTYQDGSCSVFITDSNDKSMGMFKIYPANATAWNTQTDVAVLDLVDYSGGFSPKLSTLNFSISDLDKCPDNMTQGSPLAVIGYPAFAQKIVQMDNSGNTLNFDSRTVTNGIISAYDNSIKFQNWGFSTTGSLPYGNYFVTNTIDHGNSGGIAISKYNGNLCVLGIPTWLNAGVSNNQGIVQNIQNIMYVK